jgi:hypothetical protein
LQGQPLAWRLLVMAIGVEMVVHGIAKHQAFALGLIHSIGL